MDVTLRIWGVAVYYRQEMDSWGGKSRFVTCCIPISNVKNRLGTELCTPITATKGEGSKECTKWHHDHPWNHLNGHYNNRTLRS